MLTEKTKNLINLIVKNELENLKDHITYELEDIVNGEHYDKDGNITAEFKEMQEYSVYCLIQLLSK